VYCSANYYLRADKAVFGRQESSTDGTSGPERYPTLKVNIHREPRWSQSPTVNPLRDSLSVDFIRVIMRERHLVIGITDGVVPSSNCRFELI
jgi:hypothetical protein